MGSGDNPEVLVDLRRGAGPLRARLEAELRDAVRGARLRPGARLPPSRALAADLGVSRRLVADAYAQLLAEGYLAARPGAGTWVAPAAAPVASPARAAEARARLPRFDFFPGHPDLAGFPRAAWGRAAREALAAAPDAALGYPDARGTRGLRTEIAAYLARTRAVAAAPGAVIVLPGAAAALAVLTRALVAAGRGRIAVEDPSLPPFRAGLEAAGAELVPIPVDGDGLDVAALARSGADVVLATPAHQFPTGVPLAPARRAALLEWAAAGGLLIEDDFNGEFRYDGRAVAALHGLAPERVAYLGSASKLLAPGLRLGWLVVPEALRGALIEAKLLAGATAPVLEELTLARLIARGDLDRHLRAARRRYRNRREALVAALARHLPEARVAGQDAGLYAVVDLSAPVDPVALDAAARARDVGVIRCRGSPTLRRRRPTRLSSATPTIPSRRSVRGSGVSPRRSTRSPDAPLGASSSRIPSVS